MLLFIGKRVNEQQLPLKVLVKGYILYGSNILQGTLLVDDNQERPTWITIVISPFSKYYFYDTETEILYERVLQGQIDALRYIFVRSNFSGLLYDDNAKLYRLTSKGCDNDCDSNSSLNYVTKLKRITVYNEIQVANDSTSVPFAIAVPLRKINITSVSQDSTLLLPIPDSMSQILSLRAVGQNQSTNFVYDYLNDDLDIVTVVNNFIKLDLSTNIISGVDTSFKFFTESYISPPRGDDAVIPSGVISEIEPFDAPGMEGTPLLYNSSNLNHGNSITVTFNVNVTLNPSDYPYILLLGIKYIISDGSYGQIISDPPIQNNPIGSVSININPRGSLGEYVTFTFYVSVTSPDRVSRFTSDVEGNVTVRYN